MKIMCIIHLFLSLCNIILYIIIYMKKIFIHFYTLLCNYMYLQGKLCIIYVEVSQSTHVDKVTPIRLPKVEKQHSITAVGNTDLAAE